MGMGVWEWECGLKNYTYQSGNGCRPSVSCANLYTISVIALNCSELDMLINFNNLIIVLHHSYLVLVTKCGSPHQPISFGIVSTVIQWYSIL